MDIKVLEENNAIIVSLNGRLDTVTFTELEKVLNPLVAGGKTIMLDCKDMDYISSAGLRVILSTHKQCTAANVRFIVQNLSTEVKTIFDMTGFNRLLNIE